MDYRTFDRSFRTSPPILSHDGMTARSLGPLLDRGGAVYIEDLGAGAWGFLEHCGWQDRLPSGDGLDDRGRVRADWLGELVEAAQILAREGSRQGPSGDAELWLSWMFMAVGSAADVRRHWESHGAEPLTVGSP